MASEPKVWLNVSTSARWTRPPVGIVRVERAVDAELGRLYGERFQRCVWTDDGFVQWSGPRDEGLEGEKREPVQEMKVKQEYLPWMFPILTRREGLHALGQGLLSLCPGRIRPFVNRMLYRVRWRAASLISRPLILRWRQRLAGQNAQIKIAQFLPKPVVSSAVKHNVPVHIFKRGDVLISIGLDWDSSCYKQFYALRQEFGVRVVTCCYDLIPVLFPQYCVGDVASLFASYFLDVADGSDLVLCISRQTERDFLALMDRTGGARPRTHVFPLGDNVPVATEFDVVSEAVALLCKTPYLLFVSTIERRKNHEVLYRAYHLLASEGKAKQLPRLVFVGMQGWGVSDLMKDIELDPLTCGLITRLNHVSDAELSILYQNALGCLYPSLYEGWGLPVGEALAMGKMVLSSDRGSLPEVGGDLVRYIDPWRPEDWAEGIWDLVVNENERLRCEERVRRQYKVRTWSGAAESIKLAIDELL